MNFGSVGFAELGLILLVWAVPLLLLVWFVRMISGMAASLRDIADRLTTLERVVRERTGHEVP